MTNPSRRAAAVSRLCKRTGWNTDTAWAFLHTLPYSAIPNEGDAIDVIDWLESIGVQVSQADTADTHEPAECQHEWRPFRTINGTATKCTRCGARL